MAKVVLVTGSSSGIGKAIATLFAQKGYKVILNCKSSVSKMLELQNELLKINKNILALTCDLGDYEKTSEMFKKIEDTFGNVDILINNAGISDYGLFIDTKPSNLQHTINTNLYSAINCTHLALPKMLSKHQGCIINISSIWGNVGASCEVLYSTSKSALNGFTKAIAKEVAPSKVLVNAIACGLINTNMNNNLTNEDVEAFLSDIPLSRQGEGFEVAQLCLFLAENNTYMTGQILTLDGGYL